MVFGCKFSVSNEEIFLVFLLPDLHLISLIMTDCHFHISSCRRLDFVQPGGISSTLLGSPDKFIRFIRFFSYLPRIVGLFAVLRQSLSAAKDQIC